MNCKNYSLIYFYNNFIIGESSVTSFSPGSPNDDSSGETTEKQNVPRLQRSKAQSRKTLRLRKSRKFHSGRVEVRGGGIHMQFKYKFY